jgi:hypothetical protein
MVMIIAKTINQIKEKIAVAKGIVTVMMRNKTVMEMRDMIIARKIIQKRKENNL